MLRALTLSNFRINFKEFEKNKDYIMEVYFEPKTRDEEILGHYPQPIIVPYNQGIVDTTITQNNYDCIILYDDQQVGRGCIKNVSFRRKIKLRSKNITPKESSKMAQILDTKVDSDFRKITSPSGKSYINVSDDIVEIVSGDTKFTVSKNQITTFCKKVDNNMADETKGGLFTETGILRFLPKCFVPPFSVPDYIPDVGVVYRVSKTLAIMKGLIKSLGGGEPPKPKKKKTTNTISLKTGGTVTLKGGAKVTIKAG